MISTNSELDPVETSFGVGLGGGLGIKSKAEMEEGSDGWGRGGESRDGGEQKRNDVAMSYIWPSYVGAPVWCVKILPGLRPAGTAVSRGGGLLMEWKGSRLRGGSA